MTTILACLLVAQSATLLPKDPVRSEMTSVGGKRVLIPAKGDKATLLVFVAYDCPIANRMAPEIARIAKTYKPKGVQTHLIYCERSTKVSDITKHLKDYSLPPSAIQDPKHILKKATGASVTPQAAVLDPKGKVVYLGRINNLYEEHGRASEATKNDLRDALSQFLRGEPIKTPVTEAVGCFIVD